MVKEINVTASKRDTRGTAAARRLRRDGVIPAVLCDEKGQSTAIQLQVHGFEQMLSHHSGENLMITLNLDDDPPRRVLLREVQHDPVRGTVRHADFVEVSLTKKMRVTVPVELRGEPVGVSQQGGVLEQMLREVEIECLPDDIVEEILVDVSALKVGESIYVRDLVVGTGVAIIDEGDIAVATVDAVRAEEEEPAAETTEEEKAEPEVITARREKDEKEKEEGAGRE